MPLRHIPGEAQVDYFFALVNMRGTLKKVAFFFKLNSWYLHLFNKGAVAQLGERLNGIQEVVGSIPISSTIYFQ